MPGTEAHVLQQWERVGNRAMRGAVVCALIVGASLLLHGQIGPSVWGMSLLGLLGYSLAGVLILPLLRTLKYQEQDW